MTDYSHRQSSQPELGLIQQLTRLWEELKVPQEYRMLTLSKQQQKYLMYEIQWHSSHQSHYHLIFRLNMRRKITLFKVKSLLKELKPFQNAKIEQLCLLLCNLRELNVQVSEKIIQMIQFYNLVLEEMQESKILDFLWNLINNLQDDNQPILISQYRHLFKIDDHFDPQFISYYQHQSKGSSQQLAKNAQKLYSLSIKDVYKVISLKHKIQLIMATIEYRLKSQVNTSKHSYYLKRAKNACSPSYSQPAQVEKISNTGRKYHLSSRSHSHDLVIKACPQDKQEILQSRSRLKDKLGKASTHLGKIVKNLTYSPQQSTGLKSNFIQRDSSISFSRKEQNLSNRKSEKLNHIQLQPINIKIEKLQKRASPENTSLPLKQTYQERQENTHQSQFLEYSHIKITKINNMSRKNLSPFKNPKQRSKKRYDFDQKKVKGRRIPGLIKNSKANIFQLKDSDIGLYEENPITNKGIKTAKTKTTAQQQNKQKRFELDNVGLPSKQTTQIETVSREIQTERTKLPAKHHQIKLKVDIDCQTQLEDNMIYEKANDDSQERSESQKQECNNKQEHQQAISDVKNEEKKLSDSLVTLQQQYFVDQRSTLIKKYKIPMIRTITEEQIEIIENQKKSVAKYISNKQKLKQPEIRQIQQKSKQDVQQSPPSNALKIKIGKFTLQEALAALQTYKISSKHAEIFETSTKLRQHIKNGQTYILEYLINNKIAVIALASPIPRNTVVLKLWGPMQHIDQNTSETLFLKYIEYLLKNINKIVYKGIGFGELTKAGFVNKKSDIFEKTNQNPVKKSSQFEEFFAVKCSNIYLQEEAEMTFVQEDGGLFDSNSYFCAQFIRKADLSHSSEQIANLFIQEKSVTSFQEVNKILKEQQYQHFYTTKMPQNRKNCISLLLFQFNSPMKTYFIAQNGYFVLDVIVYLQGNGKLIISFPLTKDNSFVYFGKGISIAQFNALIRNEPKKIGIDRCRIKMFSKILQGALNNNHQFGHWEISFVFEDQIKQANIKHSPTIEKQFGSQPFLVTLEVEKQILYSMTINEEDLLY